MPVPLDEILATFRFDDAGQFIGSATDPKVIQRIAEGQGVPDYTRLRVPALALYALADHWTPDYSSYAAGEREKFARAVPSARVLAIPHAKHYLFLIHRAEVVAEIERFFRAAPTFCGLERRSVRRALSLAVRGIGAGCARRRARLAG